MAAVPQTSDPTVQDLITGHFHERPGYRVVRQRGSASWLLINTLSGQGRFRHRDGERLVTQGDVALLQPRTMHEYGIAPGAPTWELQWAHFHARPHWEPFLAWPAEGPGLSLVCLEDPERTHVRQRLTDAHRLSAHGGPFDQMIAMAVLEEVLIRCRRHAEQADEGGLDPRVRQATDYIHQRLPAPISVDELAAAVGLSASRLSHLFQGELGIPPRAYIERQRLNRARQLLTHSLLSVQAVAAEVGFDSEFYFSNRFKKLTGTSPSEYRRGSRPH